MTEKDIYSNGVALLEEWEDVNYCEHSFKFKDEWLTDKEVVDLLNKLNDENEQLKQALLFFLDVANSECSSSFQKDMEHDCQKLFNCSYDEAKKKYGGYNATWWELGE